MENCPLFVIRYPSPEDQTSSHKIPRKKKAGFCWHSIVHWNSTRIKTLAQIFLQLLIPGDAIMCKSNYIYNTWWHNIQLYQKNCQKTTPKWLILGILKHVLQKRATSKNRRFTLKAFCAEDLKGVWKWQIFGNCYFVPKLLVATILLNAHCARSEKTHCTHT